VPIDPRELRRGRICLAVFPFAPEFPLTLADRSVVESVEEWARTLKGSPGTVVTEARLRPVLLLHDRTRAEHGDVVCLRINTVKPGLRAETETWTRIERHEHPFFFHLPASVARYKLREDSVIALSSLGSVHRSAILGATGGELSEHEMQIVSERLARLIELDLAPKIAAAARELIRRARG
jgi:hypothetical protein